MCYFWLHRSDLMCLLWSLLKCVSPSLELGQHIIKDVEEKVNVVFLENQRWSKPDWSISTSTQKDTCQKQCYNIDIYTVYVIQLDNTTGYALLWVMALITKPQRLSLSSLLYPAGHRQEGPLIWDLSKTRLTGFFLLKGFFYVYVSCQSMGFGKAPRDNFDCNGRYVKVILTLSHHNFHSCTCSVNSEGRFFGKYKISCPIEYNPTTYCYLIFIEMMHTLSSNQNIAPSSGSSR